MLDALGEVCDLGGVDSVKRIVGRDLARQARAGGDLAAELAHQRGFAHPELGGR